MGYHLILGRSWKRRVVAELASAEQNRAGEPLPEGARVTAVPYNEEGTQFKVTLNGITVIV